MDTSLLLTGIGFRSQHSNAFLEKRPPVAWLEVHSENYTCEGGKSLHILEQLRKDYPISLHGVGLSLGSTDELNWHHLKLLRELSSRIQPCLVSDHLSWSSVDGRYFNDLLPFPYTMESLEHIVSRIQQVQDFLKHQILVENITSYIQFDSSTYSEAAFLIEVAHRAGCGILLDINNIYVNSMNFAFDPHQFIRMIPANLVQEIHLAGFSTTIIGEKEVLIDSHNRPVVPAVWDLYRDTIKQMGLKPTIIEWDKDLPTLETLCLEAYRAEKIMRDIHATTKLTA